MLVLRCARGLVDVRAGLRRVDEDPALARRVTHLLVARVRVRLVVTARERRGRDRHNSSSQNRDGGETGVHADTRSP